MKAWGRNILIGLLGCTLSGGCLFADGMQAYFADFIDPATLSDINSATAAVSVPPAYAGCAFAPPNVVFSVNYTAGLAYRNGVLYGLEWENGSGPGIYLYSLSAGPCATGTRVGVAVGQTELESLAFCAVDGFFYSVNFESASTHQGQLVKIDPATGAGTLVGSKMTANVRIVGMVCDAQGQLWAVSSGFGGGFGRNPELLKVNRTTGAETVIGLLGLPANEVESLAIDPAAPAKLFAAGKALYEVNKSTGAASLVGGSFNQFWAMAGIPAAVTFTINAGMNDAWVSANAPFQGFFFTVYEDLKLFFLSWFTFDSVPPGQGATATFGAADQRWVTGAGFYSGDAVTINLELTTGGVFNGSVPMATQQAGYGTISIVFNSCNEAVLTYNFPGQGLSGQITLTRVVNDNVALCEALSGG